ncbi:VOC family protein [Actinomadura rubrisoli]|uniref:Bleomycin resistance protein n=1 Tax=Actinomadura rubrisoli TaxID=2530368 RepID=A0A4R5A4U1_9ACTN|nr:VOC family protein [Actinomadura rubrisoli]TDD66953.1 bleomycin resistance protein [Actinomadura rubrisoli]
MTSEIRRTFYPLISYSDPGKAIEWLERAFGFTPHEVFKDEQGNFVHTEMSYDTGIFMFNKGKPGTSALYVAVDDPDAHYARAKAAGAEIFREPADQDYGSREYAALDPEGNEWYFGTYRP